MNEIRIYSPLQLITHNLIAFIKMKRNIIWRKNNIRLPPLFIYVSPPKTLLRFSVWQTITGNNSETLADMLMLCMLMTMFYIMSFLTWFVRFPVYTVAANKASCNVLRKHFFEAFLFSLFAAFSREWDFIPTVPVYFSQPKYIVSL